MNRLKQSLSSLPTPSLPSRSPSDNSRPSPPPLPSSRLDSLTTRKSLAHNLHATFASLHKTLAKQRPHPVTGGSGTARPERWVGETCIEASEQLEQAADRGGDESDLASALSAVGTLYVQLGDLSTQLTDALALGFLTTLEDRVEDYKRLDKGLKEAEKKRSALDAVLVKAEKGKKDRSEYEQEIEQAEYAYTDECDSLARLADRADLVVSKDVEAIRQLVEDQLTYVENYAALLEQCKAALPAPSTGSSSRSRSSTLQLPTASTRMSRSQSESSVNKQPLSPIFSSLGPNRSRSSTLQASEKERSTDGGNGGGSGGSSAKNRSRSGSMLERFALGNKNKKRDAAAPAEEEDEIDKETGKDKRDGSSPSASGTSTPSRFNPSNLSMPTLPGLPTLGSLKKLGPTGSGGKYGSLGEEPERDRSLERERGAPSPTGSSFSSSSRPGSSSGSGRLVPPLFKRTQTAPASSTPSSPASSPRRAVPPPPPAPAQKGPVGKTYKAQWAYVPAPQSAATDTTDDDDEDDELSLSPGDVVRVEREVNGDWWIGVVVQTTSGGGRAGRAGMFPSAYVVPCADPQAAGQGASAAEDRWTTFSNGSATFSAESGGGRSAEHSAEEDDDDGEEEDGEENLLHRSGAGDGRTASPFRQAASASAGAPLAARRTAPRLSMSRSRSATVQRYKPEQEEEEDPFGIDAVSYAQGRGEMSR
ncbi:hypothetical protein JCM10207_002628 [Rhodosporidiobolus poonsookiae]